MKLTIPSTKEIEVSRIRVSLPVNYEEEDMPNDFPFRKGETWSVDIDIDTGQIIDWPQGRTGSFYMKVVDEGVYSLIAPDERVIKDLCDYAPNKAIPGKYGDYVDFKINENGIITNWLKNPDLSAWFKD